MKDSVINSNEEFDYGAFLTLETEMRIKISKSDLTPSLFAFTFNHAGNYVFHDHTNSQKIMIVTVKGVGEECTDPDRYV